MRKCRHGHDKDDDDDDDDDVDDDDDDKMAIIIPFTITTYNGHHTCAIHHAYVSMYIDVNLISIISYICKYFYF